MKITVTTVKTEQISMDEYKDVTHARTFEYSDSFEMVFAWLKTIHPDAVDLTRVTFCKYHN